MSKKKTAAKNHLEVVKTTPQATVYELRIPTLADLEALPPQERYKEMQRRARRYARKLMVEVEDTLAPGFSWSNITPEWVYTVIRLTEGAQYLTYPPALGFSTVKEEVLIALEKRIGYRRQAEPWGLQLAEQYLTEGGWNTADGFSNFTGGYLNSFISEQGSIDAMLGHIIKHHRTLHDEIYRETYRRVNAVADTDTHSDA